jgi:hypothetical protein
MLLLQMTRIISRMAQSSWAPVEKCKSCLAFVENLSCCARSCTVESPRRQSDQQTPLHDGRYLFPSPAARYRLRSGQCHCFVHCGVLVRTP